MLEKPVIKFVKDELSERSFALGAVGEEGGVLHSSLGNKVAK